MPREVITKLLISTKLEPGLSTQMATKEATSQKHQIIQYTPMVGALMHSHTQFWLRICQRSDAP